MCGQGLRFRCSPVGKVLPDIVVRDGGFLELAAIRSERRKVVHQDVQLLPDTRPEASSMLNTTFLVPLRLSASCDDRM